ncbi:hypothetical protein GpartN1_g6013.t1 [Galdieria partita]|uniref:Uncharacterized protein n=1 Tax=Galdieria partita TaxID=83374 RepID=A0A9C7Q299_9RHOD|nr:hypothetical protein GpartN1_g6013.t1 [Galdieria partita]
MRNWILLILGGVSVGSLSVLGDGVKLWFIIDKFSRSALQLLGRDSFSEVEEQSYSSSRVHVLIEEINRLSNEVTKTLSLLAERPRHVVYQPGVLSFVNFKTVPLLFAVVISPFILNRFFGFQMFGFWYITRRCFTITTEKWLRSVHSIADAVKQLHDHIYSYAFRIDKRIEENQKEIQQKLETHTEECKRDISVINDDLLSVRENLGKINLALDNIHGSVALTNKGIEMLCQFVLEQTRYKLSEDIFIEQGIIGELRDMTNCLQWQGGEEEKYSFSSHFSSHHKPKS